MTAELGGAGAGGPPPWPGSDPPSIGVPPAVPPPVWSAPVVPPPVARHRRRRGRRRWLLAALVSTVLAAGLGLAAGDRYAARSSPESVARAFFQALADGDAPAALAVADAPPHGQFLTSAVLRRQLQAASFADLSVLRATRSQNTATVEVRYRLLFGSGPRSVTDTARLVRRGSSWRMSRVAGTVRVSAGSLAAGRVLLAGGKLPAAAVTLFPGALPLAADPPALQVLARTSAGGAEDQPMIRLADTGLTAQVRIALTSRLREQAERAAQTLLTGCLAAASKNPLCPVPGSARPVPGSLHGSAPAIAAVHPRIELEQAAPAVISVQARVPVQGSWKVWDFENQVVQRQGSVTVVLNARVFVDRPTRAFWKPS